MRDVVEQAIIQRYNNGLDEVSTHGHGETPIGPWTNPDGAPGSGRYVFYLNMALYDSLQARRITIEHYVSHLTDEQLLAAFDSQCCLKYR